MAITYSITSYKTLAGISGTALDTLLTDLLDYAKSRFQAETGRTLDQATFTERIDGTGSSTIVVANPPITSITSIKIYRTVNDTPTAEDSSTYTFNPATGEIRYQPSYTGRFAYDSYYDVIGPNYGQWPFFPWGFQNIQVVYVGGYASSAYGNDIILAMFRIMDLLRSTAGNDPMMQSENLGSYSYTKAVTSNGLVDVYNRQIQEICRPFKVGGAAAML